MVLLKDEKIMINGVNFGTLKQEKNTRNSFYKGVFPPSNIIKFNNMSLELLYKQYEKKHKRAYKKILLKNKIDKMLNNNQLLLSAPLKSTENNRKKTIKKPLNLLDMEGLSINVGRGEVWKVLKVDFMKIKNQVKVEVLPSGKVINTDIITFKNKYKYGV